MHRHQARPLGAFGLHFRSILCAVGMAASGVHAASEVAYVDAMASGSEGGPAVGDAAAQCEQGLRSVLVPFGSTAAAGAVRAVRTQLRHLREGLHAAAAAVEADGTEALEVAAYRLLRGEPDSDAPPAEAGPQYASSDRGGLPLMLWDRMGRTRFDDLAERCGFEADRYVDAGFHGMDFQWSSEMTLGLLLLHSDGDSDYKHGQRRSMVDAGIANAIPHMHWMLEEGLYAWVYAGSGRGEAELDGKKDAEPVKTDIDMRVAAGGMRKELGERWALQADAFAMKIESEARAPVLLASARAERVRVMLEGREHWGEEEADEQLTVRYAVGARLDSGDAASGTGTEVQGDLEYRNETAGLSIKGEGWYLLTHSESDYEEWGASLELGLDPGEPDTGPWLMISPSWGTVPDDVLALWDSSVADLPDGWLPERRLDIGLGYGLHGPRGDLLTLYGGYSYDRLGSLYQGGAYWEIGENALMTWMLERRRRRGEPSETGVKFQFEMRH